MSQSRATPQALASRANPAAAHKSYRPQVKGDLNAVRQAIDEVNRPIAQQLALSSKTISTHKARLMQKLKVNSLAELVKYAMEHKLL